MLSLSENIINFLLDDDPVANEALFREQLDIIEVIVFAEYPDNDNWNLMLKNNYDNPIGNWYKVTLENEGNIPAFVAGEEHNIFFNLVERVHPNSEIGRKLYKGIGLFHLVELNGENAPQVHGEVDHVRVINVGQGNCNALCRRDGSVVAYFDFGGGSYNNANTYPNNIQYCLTNNPFVVLSHWDMDHWKGADYYPAVKTMDWIVPYQALGPTHFKFLSSLAGNVFLWPQNLNDRLFSNINIIKCQGKGRNNSGLAAIVESVHSFVYLPFLSSIRSRLVDLRTQS